MQNSNNISEKLEREAPFLSKMTKKNHFSTPKNYFEVLPEIIQSKNLNRNSLNIPFDKLSWRVLIPFTTIVIIFAVVTNWNTIDENIILTNDQLSEYIINEDDIEFDDYMVYEAYAEMIDTETETSLENQEYINYLIENDIDINSIIEEL